MNQASNQSNQTN